MSPSELRTLPSLALHAEVQDVNGKTWRWSAHDPDARNRPQNMSYRNQRGDGHADASVTLTRRIDQDYPDIALLNRLRFVADDGWIAYEGRVSEFPRDLSSDGHSITVNAAGYMASARDRKFSMVYADRDLSAWGPISDAYKIANAATVSVSDPSTEVDPTVGRPVLKLGPDRDAYTNDPYQWAMYDAGEGNAIGQLSFVRLNSAAAGSLAGNAAYECYGCLGVDASFATAIWTSELFDTGAAGPVLHDRLTDGAADYRYAGIQWLHSTNPSTGWDTSWFVNFYPVVYGDHGLTLRGTADATTYTHQGLYVSDMIRHLATNYCPQLSPAGVEDTTYVVNHAVFRGMEPYEAMQELNRYHLWELSVWDGGVLHFHAPTPLDDWDWEVRLDDRGTSVSLQGDTIENVANGVVVTYDDFTGKECTVTPDDDGSLLDPSSDNPANVWGIKRWIEPPGGKIAFPTTREDAVQIGRAALGEFATPKAAGEITVQGYIRNRRGQKQPVHRVRAGERVRIADHPNDRPRRIVDVQYTGDEMKTLRISTDNATKRIEGLFDRIATARTAAGLG